MILSRDNFTSRQSAMFFTVRLSRFFLQKYAADRILGVEAHKRITAKDSILAEKVPASRES